MEISDEIEKIIGVENYNRLVNSVNETKLRQRIFFWQEQLLNKIENSINFTRPQTPDEYIKLFTDLKPKPGWDLAGGYNSIINDTCAPVFKKLGFKKSRANFFRQTTELIQTFNFQKSPWCTRSRISFTGNIGFIEPEAYLKLNQVECVPKFPKCSDSIIEFRFGLITHGADHWYELRNQKNIDDVRSRIEQDLSLVEQLFESRKTILSLKEYIEDGTMINPYWGELGQFALYKRMGRSRAARKTLKKAYMKAQKPRNWFTTTVRNSDGSFTENKSNSEVNQEWIKRIEHVAMIFNEELE